MITSIRAADTAATVLVQIPGVLSGYDLGVTFFAMCARMLSSVGYFGAQTQAETAADRARWRAGHCHPRRGSAKP